MNDHNVIYKDEDMYGFISDIVKDLIENIKLAIENEDDIGILAEALDNARELEREDNDRFYKVWYNPMGAFIFQEMKAME